MIKFTYVASTTSHPSSHMVPKVPLKKISTLPRLLSVDPRSLIDWHQAPGMKKGCDKK